LQQNYQKTDELTKSLKQHVLHALEKQNLEFNTLSGKLSTLNPTAILKRGYSITTTQAGHIIKNSDTLKGGDLIKTKLAKGEIISKVTNK